MSHPSKRGEPASSVPLPFIVVIAIVVAAFAVGWHLQHRAPSREAFAQQLSDLGSAHAETQLFVTGTLAPLGSFQYKTSPIETRLAVLDRHAQGAFLRYEITRDQAAEVKADTDSIEAIVAQATRLCSPAPHTGKCRGPRGKIDALLAEAQREVASVPDYAPKVQF